MAIYRFRISFEDYDEVVREIEMLPKHTFLDLHLAIQKNLGYEAEAPSSFYISNDQWKKGQEITYLPSENKINQKVILMENSRLNQFIDDPHQKFYYTYNFSRPYDFHVQLIKILAEEEGKTYPSLFKSIGTAPKPFNQTTIIEAALDEEEDKEFDFLNEMEYASEDAEDMDIMDEEDIDETDQFSESDSSDDNY